MNQYKKGYKYEAKRLRTTIFAISITSKKSDNYMGSINEKSHIALKQKRNYQFDLAPI